MSLSLRLGFTQSGAPLTWSGAANPHIAISGRSGCGKSHFMKGLLEQAARQGAVCLVLDYSSDFRGYVPPDKVCFRRIDVAGPDFTINPLAGVPDSGTHIEAQRLLSALHGIFRMGPRANLALQKATLSYLGNTDCPTLQGLLDYVEQAKAPSIGLAAALEPLELLSTLVRCGDCPISLDLTSPGITVLSFEQIVDGKLRTLLVELVLGAVWDQRVSVEINDGPPLILMLDECQTLNWSDSGMAVRILREGRKYGLAGWFSSQYITNKNAAAALGQAALQARFRPDDADIPKLAKALGQTGSGKTRQWEKVIRTLQVGQFLLQKPDGRIFAVAVPKRASPFDM